MGRLPAQVLPATAHASIVARLVPSQTPAGAFAALEAHFNAVASRLFRPGTVAVDVARLGFQADPVLVSPHSLANDAAAEVLAEMYGGRAPYEKRMGGSIPAIGYFKQAQRGPADSAACPAPLPCASRIAVRCACLYFLRVGRMH